MMLGLGLHITATNGGTGEEFADGEGRGTSVASASVAGVGASTAEAVGSSSGIAAVAASTLAATSGAGSSDGVATVAAIGKSTAESAGSSAGIATPLAVGTTTGGGVQEGAGSSTSVATASATGEGVSITIETATYTRGAAGVSPLLDSSQSSTGTLTADFYLDVLTVTNGTTPSQADMDNGSGTGVIEKVTVGPEATLAALAGTNVIDLNSSVTNGRMYLQYRDSSGTPIKSNLFSVATEDAINYDAVAPAFASATIANGSPDTLPLVLSKDSYVAQGETLAIGDFTFGGTLAAKLSGGSVVRTNATTYTFTLTSDAVSGETGTIALPSGTLVGIDTEAASFTAQSITNNVVAAGGGLTQLGSAVGLHTGFGTSKTLTLDLTGYAGQPLLVPITCYSCNGSVTTATLGGVPADSLISLDNSGGPGGTPTVALAQWDAGHTFADGDLDFTLSASGGGSGAAAFTRPSFTSMSILGSELPLLVRASSSVTGTPTASSDLLGIWSSRDGPVDAAWSQLTFVDQADQRTNSYMSVAKADNVPASSRTVTITPTVSCHQALLVMEIT